MEGASGSIRLKTALRVATCVGPAKLVVMLPTLTTSSSVKVLTTKSTAVPVTTPAPVVTPPAAVKLVRTRIRIQRIVDAATVPVSLTKSAAMLRALT